MLNVHPGRPETYKILVARLGDKEEDKRLINLKGKWNFAAELSKTAKKGKYRKLMTLRSHFPSEPTLRLVGLSFRLCIVCSPCPPCSPCIISVCRITGPRSFSALFEFSGVKSHFAPLRMTPRRRLAGQSHKKRPARGALLPRAGAMVDRRKRLTSSAGPVQWHSHP